jgi:hypothetical protein
MPQGTLVPNSDMLTRLGHPFETSVDGVVGPVNPLFFP